MRIRATKRLALIGSALLVLGTVGAVAALQKHRTARNVATANTATNQAAEAANNSQPSAPTPQAAPPDQSTTPQQTAAPAQKPTATTPSYSTDQPDSIWMVVNKQHGLPSSYVPSDLVAVGNGKQLRREAADAVKQLVAAAKAGSSLKYVSGYRSYSYQATLYNNYVQSDGQAKADTYSARPGHSEHQTGLAIDIGNADGSCELDVCFGQTVGGQWIATHAHEYGFVIRYAADKTAITGYQYEPWHLRYVGTWLAGKIHDNPQTLEEYFGLGAAPSY